MVTVNEDGTVVATDGNIGEPGTAVYTTTALDDQQQQQQLTNFTTTTTADGEEIMVVTTDEGMDLETLQNLLATGVVATDEDGNVISLPVGMGVAAASSGSTDQQGGQQIVTATGHQDVVNVVGETLVANPDGTIATASGTTGDLNDNTLVALTSTDQLQFLNDEAGNTYVQDANGGIHLVQTSDGISATGAGALTLVDSNGSLVGVTAGGAGLAGGVATSGTTGGVHPHNAATTLSDLQQTSGILYRCPSCTQSYQNANAFTKHMREKHFVKVYTCRQCDHFYETLSALFLHARRSHVDPKKPRKNAANFKYHCGQCSYMTNNGGTMEHHRRAHNGDKPYSCEICGKSFAQKANMKTHKNRHIHKDRIFRCETCSKAFNSYDIYLAHLRTREHELREHFQMIASSKLLLACLGCSATFESMYNLNKHTRGCELLRSCTAKFQCKTCDSVFVDIGDLKSHVKSHEGNQIISCPVCGERGFPGFNQLNHHITRAHALKVNRRHVCRYCESTFESKKDLDGHIREMHAEERNARQSRGAVGRLRCRYANCDFTTNSVMLMERHQKQHLQRGTDGNYAFPLSTPGSGGMGPGRMSNTMRQNYGGSARGRRSSVAMSARIGEDGEELDEEEVVDEEELEDELGMEEEEELDDEMAAGKYERRGRRGGGINNSTPRRAAASAATGRINSTTVMELDVIEGLDEDFDQLETSNKRARENISSTGVTASGNSDSYHRQSQFSAGTSGLAGGGMSMDASGNITPKVSRGRGRPKGSLNKVRPAEKRMAAMAAAAANAAGDGNATNQMGDRIGSSSLGVGSSSNKKMNALPESQRLSGSALSDEKRFQEEMRAAIMFDLKKETIAQDQLQQTTAKVIDQDQEEVVLNALAEEDEQISETPHDVIAASAAAAVLHTPQIGEKSGGVHDDELPIVVSAVSTETFASARTPRQQQKPQEELEEAELEEEEDDEANATGSNSGGRKRRLPKWLKDYVVQKPEDLAEQEAQNESRTEDESAMIPRMCNEIANEDADEEAEDDYEDCGPLGEDRMQEEQLLVHPESSAQQNVTASSRDVNIDATSSEAPLQTGESCEVKQEKQVLLEKRVRKVPPRSIHVVP